MLTKTTVEATVETSMHNAFVRFLLSPCARGETGKDLKIHTGRLSENTQLNAGLVRTNRYALQEEIGENQ